MFIFIRKRSFFGFILLMSLVQWLLPLDSWSMPYFARKYGVSCTMCHTTYPKLNSTGESFRLHGYRFAQGDEGLTRIKQTPIGGKKAANISSIFPAGGVGYLRAQGVEEEPFTFELHEVEFFFGDSLGDTFYFWSDFKLIDEGEHPGRPFSRIFLGTTDLLGKWLPHNVFNAKVGYFEPAINAFSSHRRLQLQQYLYNNTRIVSATDLVPSSFRVRDSQVGAELNGIIMDRVFYAVAVTNGSGNINDFGVHKDSYVRLAWKPVGMDFNGAGASDLDLRVGSFGYFGDTDYRQDGPQFRNSFYRVGGDIKIGYKGFEFEGLLQFGKDNNLDAMGGEVETNSFFGELSYNNLWDFLTPVVRYEEFNFDNATEDVEQFVLGAIAQVSPNLRITLQGLVFVDDKDGGDSAILEVRFSF